jgi:adenosylcobinamide kinase/adenosylcobinamide-phosphate guanylyltransferase
MAPLVDTPHAGPSRPRSNSKLTLVLGGARSGKSAYAESLALEIAGAAGEVLYIATAEALDGEMKERIQRHRARRGPSWRTVEEPLDLVAALERHARPDQPIIIDCLTLWMSNLLGAGRGIAAESQALADAIDRTPAPVILITNEVGQGIVPDNALARAFRDEAGLVNQLIAARAERVVLIVAGLPLVLKHTPQPAKRAP